MRIKMNRLWASLLALIMAVSLAGCDDTSSVSATPEPTPMVTATPEPEPIEPPATATPSSWLWMWRRSTYSTRRPS